MFMAGCAASYKPMFPASFNYSIKSNLSDSLDFGYKYDVLRQTENKKLAKKEVKKNFKLVAVKITNNTGRKLNIQKDVSFYLGSNEVTPLSPESSKSVLKQNVAGYIPYAILTITKLIITKDFETKVYPIGYILGPLLTGANMGIANSANKNLLKNLNENNIYIQDLEPGKTGFGLIGVLDNNYSEISVKLKK
jgi:hypothetical protein